MSWEKAENSESDDNAENSESKDETENFENYICKLWGATMKLRTLCNKASVGNKSNSAKKNAIRLKSSFELAKGLPWMFAKRMGGQYWNYICKQIS